tara:strand:- start:1931 stop:2182 length:252 start_codon:yes stop_codon:yes gene_type:complete
MFNDPEYTKLLNDDFDTKLMIFFEDQKNNVATVDEITTFFNTKKQYIQYLLEIRQKFKNTFWEFGLYEYNETDNNWSWKDNSK